MKKKYIIEISDDKVSDFLVENNTHLFIPYSIVGYKRKCDTGLSITPYTEPDLEQAKDEAYNEGYKAGREAEKVRQSDLERVKKTAHDDGYSEGYQAGREDLNRVMSAMPDLEQVRKEAYEKGYHAGYVKYLNKSYEDGLKDAWEAARKISDIPYNEGEKIFGVTGWHIIEKRTASEVIEKLKAYEQEKEEELGIQGYFKNGEEVIDADGTKAVVLSVSEDNFCQVYTEKGCIENWHIHTYKFHKTGRYFSEIATVLEKMRGEDND